MEQKITLELTLGEVNAVLGALGQMPFMQVADLITNVHNQATEQLSPPEAKSE